MSSPYARTGEELWYWLGWEPSLSTEWADWVGPAPRLSAADAGTSFAQINTPKSTGFIEHGPIAYFAPAKITDATYSSVQVKSHDDSQFVSVVLCTLDGNSQVWQYFEAPADSWVAVDLSPWAQWAVDDGWGYDYSTIVAAAETEGFAVLIVPSYFGGSNRLDVSYVGTLGVEARPIATRVYPRADGLGMGAPRIMDNRSPYRSARVFGMI